METIRRNRKRVRLSLIGLIALTLLIPAVVSCSSSHHSGRRTDTNLDPGWPKGNDFFHEPAYGRLSVDLPVIPEAEYIEDDEFCLTCHEVYTKSFEHNVHRGQSCESCHGPASRHMETRGKEPGLILSFKTLPAAQKSELCLKCHEENGCAPGPRWRHSKHAHRGVSCTDCHRSHYNVPPGTPATTETDEAVWGRPDGQVVRTSWRQQDGELPSLAGTSNQMGATSPGVCYECHGEMRQYQEIAGAHQICGPNGFNCTTCHDPHGKIIETSRKELCLTCHDQETPAMSFDSSCHDRKGVACTDCHNPHPKSNVPRVVQVSHTSVTRPRRMPMAVDDPQTCYKCHPKVFGMNSMPSHHPIQEGKMVCSDCHDAHGQLQGNLKADSVNQLCYECHAEKEGPFVYDHPPVSEDCSYCHEPHGSVTDNLLRQPTTFLCLRCHAGHRRGLHSGGPQVDIDGNTALRPSYYTDCTNCHSEIHGSDLPSVHRQQSLLR